MRFLPALSLVASATALPGLLHLTYVQPWAPPGPGDVRGPCPGLNTLANHGYLPHDGKNLRVEQIGDAVAAGYGWNRTIGTGPATELFEAIGKNPEADTIDLMDLARPPKEHRASLTREDAPDQVPVSQPRLRAMLDDAGPATPFLTPESIARTRNRVEALSTTTGAHGGGGGPPLSEADKTAGLSEASLLLLAMTEGPCPAAADRHPAPLRAPKDRVRAWITRERLPVEFGWHRPHRVVQFEDIPPVAAQIAKAMKA